MLLLEKGILKTGRYTMAAPFAIRDHFAKP
jgi:hypothetical protein